MLCWNICPGLIYLAGNSQRPRCLCTGPGSRLPLQYVLGARPGTGLLAALRARGGGRGAAGGAVRSSLGFPGAFPGARRLSKAPSRCPGLGKPTKLSLRLAPLPSRPLGPKLRDGVFYVSRRHGDFFASLLDFYAFFTRSCFFVLFYFPRRGSEMQTASI
jgi:hypothetical protein